MLTMSDLEPVTHEAKAPRCRECGAPQTGREVSCGFCRAPLATLRCGHCYRLNHPDMDYCNGCGEHLGLEPVPLGGTLECSSCGGAMIAFEDEQAGLWDCEQCQSQFVAHLMLQALIAGRQRWDRVNAPKPRVTFNRSIRYVRCPMCQEWMARRNFGGTSGVVVDVCAAHGVWFDAWELQQVLAFVEAGGLADMRRAALGLPPPQTKAERERAAQAIAEALERTRRLPSEADTAREPRLWETGLELFGNLVEQWLRRTK